MALDWTYPIMLKYERSCVTIGGTPAGTCHNWIRGTTGWKEKTGFQNLALVHLLDVYLLTQAIFWEFHIHVQDSQQDYYNSLTRDREPRFKSNVIYSMSINGQTRIENKASLAPFCISDGNASEPVSMLNSEVMNYIPHAPTPELLFLTFSASFKSFLAHIIFMIKCM